MMNPRVATLALACVLLGGICRAASSAMQVRQVVIRAPEAEVVGLTAAPSKRDADLAAALWQAVKDGRASVVSDVESVMDEGGAAQVSSGQHVWLPSEIDQEFDHLFMIPSRFEEKLIGTSLNCRLLPAHPLALNGSVSLDWETHYAPRPPLTVKWPCSWLNIRESDQTVGNRAIHGWLDWHDLFEESVSGAVQARGAGWNVIAMMPPGDQVWPGEPKSKERWLDVFLAKTAQSTLQKEAAGASSPANRTMLFGIALGAYEAAALVRGRESKEDANLLQGLLAKVQKGSARLMLCAGYPNDPAGRRELISARQHNFPTEMPSIPSGWGSQWVGTHLEIDHPRLNLRQDLAEPGRTEWKLAKDVPQAIMWEPRFRRLGIQSHATGEGTHLLSLLHVPGVMQGEGIGKNETLLIFSKNDGPNSAPTATVQDPFSQQVGVPRIEALEVEMMVFEVPAKEAVRWQPADENQWRERDGKRSRDLLQRVEAGTATIAAHIVMRMPDTGRGKAEIAEDYMTATEFDPPELPNSPRMRPTTLETLPVGSRWEVERSGPLEDGFVSLKHEFVNSTAKPVEPGLAETLAIAATEKDDYPGALHHTETWAGVVKLVPGQLRCLGVRKPPGVRRAVLHVAFMRARAVP